MLPRLPLLLVSVGRWQSALVNDLSRLLWKNNNSGKGRRWKWVWYIQKLHLILLPSCMSSGSNGRAGETASPIAIIASWVVLTWFCKFWFSAIVRKYKNLQLNWKLKNENNNNINRFFLPSNSWIRG